MLCVLITCEFHGVRIYIALVMPGTMANLKLFSTEGQVTP